MNFFSLTGVAPFQGLTYQEVLEKNKECKIVYNEVHWKKISPEAKDLVMKMLTVDPEERINVRDALEHSWFTLENISASLLSSVQENMKSHPSVARFEPGKKPGFSMVTCTPLLNSKYANLKDSPLFLPSPENKVTSPFIRATNKLDRTEEIKKVI